MMPPGLCFAIGIPRRCAGIWQFLNSWINGRTAVQLERERNRATADVIQLLPPGSDFFESESAGRTRVIRMPEIATRDTACQKRQPDRRGGF